MKTNENNNPTTLAEDTAIAITACIEETVVSLTVEQALGVIEIVEAGIEKALEIQRQEMLKAGEN
jgi:hypothetical protein